MMLCPLRASFSWSSRAPPQMVSASTSLLWVKGEHNQAFLGQSEDHVCQMEQVTLFIGVVGKMQGTIQ